MSTKLEILHEDNHIIILNKKTGDIVQGDKTGDLSLDDRLREFIKVRDHKPGNVFIGVVHRLDRPTSGAIIFAKTSKGLFRMNDVFKTRKIRKVYWALVKEKPPKDSDRLVNYLKKNPRINKVRVYPKEVEKSKIAILEYKVIQKLDNFYLLEVELFTGRPHQIRAQLSNIGCPIKGDLKYGYPRSNPDAGISLHARKLEFIHPVAKTEIEIIAPVPKNDKLWKTAESLVPNKEA